MCGGEQVVAERSGGIAIVVRQAANDQLRVRARGVLDRSGEKNSPGAAFVNGLSIGAVDREAVCKDEPDIAILGGPLCRHRRSEAFRKVSLDYFVRHFQIELKADFHDRFFNGLRRRGHGCGRLLREDRKSTKSEYESKFRFQDILFSCFNTLRKASPNSG